MKRTDRLSNFIALLLFLAFAIYAGAYAIRSLRDTTVTAEMRYDEELRYPLMYVSSIE